MMHFILKSHHHQNLGIRKIFVPHCWAVQIGQHVWPEGKEIIYQILSAMCSGVHSPDSLLIGRCDKDMEMVTHG